MSLHFDLPTLREMLTYCRPCGSVTDAEFCARYITSLPGTWIDPYGNYHVIIDDPSIIWSCHTDTVHRTEGRQTVHYDARADRLSLSRRARESSSCLGADDTTGVWLARQLVLAGVPGHYIWHWGEECGGLGAYDLATYGSDLLAGAQCAIALDRAGVSDVITHQGGRRTCSDAFARSIADRVGLGMAPCPHGIYTDTAEYPDLIGECTNLSVGYYRQHGIGEYQDVGFLRRLLPALAAIRIDDLCLEREAGADPWLDDDDAWSMDQFAWAPWRYDGAGIDTQTSLYLDPTVDEINRTVERMEQTARAERMSDE